MKKKFKCDVKPNEALSILYYLDHVYVRISDGFTKDITVSLTPNQVRKLARNLKKLARKADKYSSSVDADDTAVNRIPLGP